MLFSSPTFLFVFLPITLLFITLTIRFFGRRFAIYPLILASLIFYGMWEISEVLIILLSIMMNFLIAQRIQKTEIYHRKKQLFITGIATNLIALGYYKYTGFFIENLKNIGIPIQSNYEIILPLGLSFYTFQQIVFLSDIYHQRIKEITLKEYVASVLFFPHLIAGPMVHYQKIISQLRDSLEISFQKIAAGFMIFVIGLSKKLLLADNLSVIASPLFHQATTDVLDMTNAWKAGLAYTGQLYFDFSGYSDMAIGLGLMFGIMLPVNFLSPYKSSSIIEFWKRWHITLSEFLRDHLYFPLGGSHGAPWKRYLNLMIVMILGGLWHGAAWTFVVWGCLHGMYLCINHAWRKLNINIKRPLFRHLVHLVSIAITFMCVLVAWVFFRAETVHSAIGILQSMVGYPTVEFVKSILFEKFIIISFAIFWFTPSTAEWFGLSENDNLPRNLAVIESRRQPTYIFCVVVTAFLFWACLFSIIGTAPSEFIYFRF